MTSAEKIMHENTVKANLFAAKLLIALAVISLSSLLAMLTGFSRDNNQILHRELYIVLSLLLIVAWGVLAFVIIKKKGNGKWMQHIIIASFIASGVIQSFSVGLMVSWMTFILGGVYSVRFGRPKETGIYGIVAGVIAIGLTYLLIPYSLLTGNLDQELIMLKEDATITVQAGANGFIKAIPDYDMLDMGATYRMATFNLIPVLTGYVFIMLILTFFAKLSYDRDIEHLNSTEKIQQAFDEERQNMSLIRSLCKDYRSVFHMDLENGNLKVVNTTDSFSYYHRSSATHYSNDLKIDVFFGKYIDDYVKDEKDAEVLRNFLIGDNLREALTDQEIITGSFHAVEDGKKHTYSFRIVRLASKMGKPTEAIVAFRIIDAMVAEEKRRNAELERQANEMKTYNAIISNAGMGVWFITFEDGKAPRFKANEKMLEILGLSEQNISEEELYSFWYGRITEEALPTVQVSLQEMSDGQFSEITFRWEHPVKGNIFVRCGGKGVKGDDGETVLSGYYCDVTDIMNDSAEKRLKASIMSDLI